MMTYLVPKDTAEILASFPANTERNLYMEFNKFIREWQWEPDEKDHLQKYQIKNRKHDAFKRIRKLTHPSADEALKYQLKRNINTLKEYEKLGCKVISVDKLNTQWRLAVGVGSSGPLETGMTLHHLYGYPYIPATSVKGIARSCAYLLDEDLSKLRMQIFNNYVEKIETKELPLAAQTDKLIELLKYKDKIDGKVVIQQPSDEEITVIKENREKLEIIRCIFGSQSSIGAVTFLDALPEKFPTLDVDVLAPHYGKYYMGEEAPGDWMQPVPSFFLTVAPGSSFIFSFFLSNNLSRYKDFKYSQEQLADMTEKWLVEGLKQLGIGGKTSAGYGYFEDPDERIEIKPPKKITENTIKHLNKGEAIAEIVSIQNKQVKVKIEGPEVDVVCSGVKVESLGLIVGSKVIVSLNLEGKNKKIVSCKYLRRI